MPSGLVFVAIIVIWAVILAPRVVRVYERGTSQRTTQRFRSAMSVLGRSQQDRVRIVHRSKHEPPGAQQVWPATRGSATAAVRRRRTLLVLCALPAITVLAVAVGPVPPAMTIVALLPVAAFLVACARVPLRSTAPNATSANPEAISSPAKVVPPTRRLITDLGVTTPHLGLMAGRDLSAFRSRSSASSSRRRGAWSQAQEMSYLQVQEQQDALAATYSSVEEQLGLDHYVTSPSGVDGRPYKRAANE